MTVKILDGRLVAKSRYNIVEKELKDLKEHGLLSPKLAVIQIGDNQASSLYIKYKRMACEAVGIKSLHIKLDTNITTQQLITEIHQLNDDSSVNGILVQLPLPAHIDTQSILEQIDINKDVDGFHPYNMGALAQGNPKLRPCTPKGIMTLLDYYNISVTGKKCVVIGVSNIVGRPMLHELLLKKATVTLCHSKTTSIGHYTKNADIIISATGSADVIGAQDIKPGAVVIDVGIIKQESGAIRGDIDFKSAAKVASAMTPVPGGVGPMTVASLIENTLQAFKIQKAL